jgi:acyl dehydratase
MLGASIFSRLLGTEFPGPGTIYLSQTLRFLAPVYPDVPLRARLEIIARRRQRVTLRTVLSDAEGLIMIDGEAEVRLPPGA